MMNRINRIFLSAGVLMLVLLVQESNAQGFLKASNKQIVNQKGENVLLRGIGLGGWMLQEGYMLKVPGEGQQYKIRERIEKLMSAAQTDEFYDTWLKNHTTKADIDSLKKWGFNSIRLPMHYNLYTLPVEKEAVAGQNTWLDRGFALTDSLLSWCKANQMYLILDMHAAPGGQGNDLNISDRDPSKPSLWQSDANQRKMIALWRKLAERYANEPWIGAYDIINEPNWGFENPVSDKNGTKEQKNEPLRKLMVDITNAIREVDKNHIVIIEGNGWGNNYNGILPLWDSNMVMSFHKYWNKNDLASIQHILNYREKNNVPVWLGETGENSNVWFTEAIRLLESNNIGWAWWPLKKLGSNNPMEIRSNINYENILKYWAGKGNKPNESNAYSGLLELAIYSRTGSNIIHRDVVDAMIRQPSSAETKPFKTNFIVDGAVLKAVDYDLGRNGIAYFDTDTTNYSVPGKPAGGNKGHVYRNDGVDIRKDSLRYERYYVSDIEAGEWLQYTVNVAKKGIYSLKFEVASDTDGGALTFSSDSKKFVPKKLSIPVTGGLKSWKVLEINDVRLSAGKQVFRIFADSGGFNFSSLTFSRQK